MTVKPVGYRVLVEQLPHRSMGNIVVPENATDQNFFRYKVIDVGEKCLMANGESLEIPCKVGDEIMFNAARAIPCGPPEFFDGRKIAIVEADAIMAIFEGEPDIKPKLSIARTDVRRAVKELVH